MAEEDGRTRPAGSQPEARSDSCRNCGADAGSRFCPECGQDQQVDPRSVVQWLKDVADDFLGLNGKLPQTLKDLFRPGILTREWLRGRRRRYVHPLRLFLVSGLLLFAVPRLSPSEPYATVNLVELTMDEMESTVWSEEIDRGVTEVGPTVMIVLAPLFAVMLRFLYLRSGRVYAEHLVFALNFHTAMFLLLIPPWLMILYDHRVPDSIQWAFVLFPALIVVHLYGGLRRVYGSRPLGAFVRSTVLLFVQLFAIGIGLVMASDLAFDQPQDQLREAAFLYRDFDSARIAGDTARVHELLPRALVAYARGEIHAVDAHSRYHLADLMMEAARSEPAVEAEMQQSALRLLRECLVAEPEGLLCLGLGARAADALGRPELAADLRARFRKADSDGGDSWDHAAHLAAYRRAATEAAASETPSAR